MHKRAEFLPVWLLLLISFFVTQGTAQTDSAILLEGERRPVLLAAEGLQLNGGVTAARLNRIFDAARANEVELTIGPSESRHDKSARSHEGGHPPLVVPMPLSVPAPYRRTFRGLASHPAVTDHYDDLIQDYSHRYGLDARLVKSIVAAESEFNPAALSPRGARGLMQVMPRTSGEMGVPAPDLNTPGENIRAGAGYLELLFRAAYKKYHLHGSYFVNAPMWIIQRVIAAYHAGPRFLGGRHWYRITRNYVRKVLLYYQSKITDIRRPPESRRELPHVSLIPISGIPY